MRSSIVLGAAATLFAVPAFAADLGNVQPLPTPNIVQAAPDNNWTGFYLGVLGGYGWGQAGTNIVGDIDADGFDVGGYAGANWQWGNFVIGAEGDIAYPFRDGSSGPVSVEQGFNGSFRGRAGIALDRFLLYGTGGAAVTNLEVSGGGLTDDKTLWGWTAGGGVEAEVIDNITARIEYRYTDYEDKTFTLGGGPVSTDFTTHTLRGGIGLKF